MAETVKKKSVSDSLLEAEAGLVVGSQVVLSLIGLLGPLLRL